MKKHLSFFVMIFFVSFAFSQTVSVEQQLIRTSGFTVHAAHKSFIAGGISTGNLSKSIEHQRYAVLQFKTGNISTAVHHSIYARNLAFLVIEANGGKINQNFAFTNEETQLSVGSPEKAILDNILTGKTLRDEDFANPQLTGIDL